MSERELVKRKEVNGQSSEHLTLPLQLERLYIAVGYGRVIINGD